MNIICVLNMENKDIICLLGSKRFIASGRAVSCYIFVGFKNPLQFPETFQCLDFTFLQKYHKYPSKLVCSGELV